jgi:putative toxin-antitoxin system antitoxin component (TIGR02293 family)
MAYTKSATVRSPILGLLGGTRVVGKLRDAAALEARVKKGLPFRALEQLMNAAHLSRDQAVKLFALPARTFVRRKRAGTLTFEETDRVVQFAELFALATQVLGKSDNAARWLQASNPYLGDIAPVERLDNALGRRAVQELLNRIAYGMLA